MWEERKPLPVGTLVVIEREDVCSESSYVVELTECGQNVIQFAYISEIDPKYPWIMPLGCTVNNFSNMPESLPECNVDRLRYPEYPYDGGEIRKNDGELRLQQI